MNRWALNYDACVACGTTERPHECKGLCARCRKRHGKPPRHAWSVNYARCVECGRADRPHKGHGLCIYCHNATRRGKSEGPIDLLDACYDPSTDPLLTGPRPHEPHLETATLDDFRSFLRPEVRKRLAERGL